MALTSGLACLVSFLALTSANNDQSRWSRQISSYTADISDWVPLPGPVEREPTIQTAQKRQSVAEPRILAEPFPGFTRPTGFSQDGFPPRNYFQGPPGRPLYLQSVPAVPSAPQNFLNDQGFGNSIRFGLSQPNFPLNQGFVAPQFPFDSAPPVKSRPLSLGNPIKFDNYPKQTHSLSPQAKPFNNQQSPKKLEGPKFVDGYRLENISNDFSFKRKPQSLQKIKFDSFDKTPKTETLIPHKSKLEREEVQLLYVPVESLNRGQFNFKNPQIQNGQDIYSQGLPKASPVKQNFAQDFQKPIDGFQNFGQDYYSGFNTAVKELDQVPKFSTISSPFPTQPPTTSKPKKLKPHQPPLAVFMTQESKRGTQVKVGDVLSSLKNTKTIAVLDTVNPATAPRVFIGPSTLNPPDNFVKFELPYLSNIENSEKKIRQLPFFVAPLSYNTPEGFAKIPFPSPHVGSVVINSQIKDVPKPVQSAPIADVIPNSYSAAPPSYKEPNFQSQSPVPQKPTFSYYSTSAPKTNPPANEYQSNYYTIEPQTVSSIRPPQIKNQDSFTAPPKPGNYYSTNQNENPSQYVSFPSPTQRPQEQVNSYIPKETTTTQRTTVSSSTAKPSTYPSQLLETHNPYSINQAFHFSTPLDYHSFFDEGYATPGSVSPSPSPPSTTVNASPSPSTSSQSQEIVTEKPKYYQQSSPSYLQNYSPEIHYESDNQNTRYPTYSSSYSSKAETEYTSSPASQSTQGQTSVEYNRNVESLPPALPDTGSNDISTSSADSDIQSTISPFYHNSYQSLDSEEKEESTSSTTTSTTRRAPLRTRGRPRYTTPKPDSGEYSTKSQSTVTRRPLRERKPLPPRPKYEPNKISSEKPTRKPSESHEATTKSTRTRTRGRVHFKSTDTEEIYDKRQKEDKKDQDLAYQRDVLHQNYPVTLMERMSTVDIEAITEPIPRISSTRVLETASDSYDTEKAYTNEKASLSFQGSNEYGSREETQTNPPYVPKLPSTRFEEHNYPTKSSSASVENVSFDAFSPEQEDESHYRQTPTPKPEIVSYATESLSPVTETVPNYSTNNEHSSRQEDFTNAPETEPTKASVEISHEKETEENIIETTPAYNRVRVRPGAIRKYQQASTTEATKVKIERRRPQQAVTYRPAFNRRQTTMRIEEIAADLKTKQVSTRPEFQEYRHPVYKPEPTTEAPATSASQEVSTQRSQFRRRRPTYTTTSSSTESSSISTRKTFEIKNRFRGRRPTTEKAAEKSEAPAAEVSVTTVKNTPYNRYSHRPRLSERFNKKPEPEEQSEDQDSNFSINRPRYVSPDSEQWSPKLTSDTFKPYNPNDILDDSKFATTEHRSSEEDETKIITARNDYEEILISVTPATNNLKNGKKIPDIPPTLEALVEQSKQVDTTDKMSTFESMLEEVMKSLEEQDEDEYTHKVMKHKGGEIGEIPPESIVSSEESKLTTSMQQEATTPVPAIDDAQDTNENEERKNHRRGFWKKVKVRPVASESIETAESQFYSHTVNRLGEPVKNVKNIHDKLEHYDKAKVTTYKPSFQFIQDIFNDEEELPVIPTVDIPKVEKNNSTTKKAVVTVTTESFLDKETPTENVYSPGEMDLGTGSPDPSFNDFTTATEATSSESGTVDRSDGFSLMDYLFGVTSNDEEEKKDVKDIEQEISTEPIKSKVFTTESTFIPEEITDATEVSGTDDESKKVENKTEEAQVTVKSVKVETSSISSFMDPTNVVSTSMSTEVSHETEICFRGKCIKTRKDINL